MRVTQRVNSATVPASPAIRFRLRPGLLVVGALAVILAAGRALPQTPVPPARNLSLLATASLAQPLMQSVNAPLPIARVAEVGGDGREAWAFGYTTATNPGYDLSRSLGQVVFLHYQGDGWQITGPPEQAGTNQFVNVQLYGIAVSPRTGEGWAVGSDRGGNGVLVHHSAGGGNRWVVDSTAACPGTSLTGKVLDAVSLRDTPSGLAGFVVGQGMSVYKLADHCWEADPDAATLATTTGSSADLVSVDFDPRDTTDAWAVTGDASTSLIVVHHSGTSWTRVSTKTMFDSAPTQADNNTGTGAAGQAGTQNQVANGGAIAVDGHGGAWVVGRMKPTDSNHPLVDTVTGDFSRPFAIHVPAAVAWPNPSAAVDYCPEIDSVNPTGTDSSGGTPHGVAAPSYPCITGGTPGLFPLAAFGLTSVQVFGDEVFAGGEGFFHLNGADSTHPWIREPDGVGYLTSLAMVSPVEGWAIGTGSNQTSGNPLSDTLAIGHWTTQPTVPAAATWPDPDADHLPLESVALSPDGSGAALAVGGSSRLSYLPGFGWNSMKPGLVGFHAVAWPAPNIAWSVGNGGRMEEYNGRTWLPLYGPRPAPGSGVPNMFAVAFDGPALGWAGGTGGTLWDYQNAHWRLDDSPLGGDVKRQTYFAIGTFPGGAVASGDNGQVVVTHGDGWTLDREATALDEAAAAQYVPPPPPGFPPPTLPIFAAASLPDGTVALGGAHGLILLRAPDGSWSRLGAHAQPRPGVDPNVDATVFALGLSRSTSGALRLVGSFSPGATSKYLGTTLSATSGWVFEYDESSGWHDLQLDHSLTMWASTDTAAERDPVLAIAMDPRSPRGWAVGGYPAWTVDLENRAYEPATTTGVLDRVDLTADPAPSSTLLNLPPRSTKGLSFAFFGESSCAAGLCGAALGSGDLRDSVVERIRSEIEFASHQPGGPQLALFGGNMAAAGLPDELSLFKQRYLDHADAQHPTGWSMPIYAAMGTQDLATGIDTGQVGGPPPTAQSTVQPQTQKANTTGGFYLDQFLGEPLPWGTAPAPPGVKPERPAGASSSQAASYYAFEFTPRGGRKPEANFIVVDDSQYTLAGNGQNPAGNGSTQTEDQWLTGAITGTSKGEPSIVVANLPPADPSSACGPTAAATFSTDVEGTPPGTNAATAVFASGFKTNQFCPIPPAVGNPVPVYISGGGGSPLDGNPPQEPLGGFHGWLLVNVDRDNTKAPVSPPQAMPVLQWLAMSLEMPTPLAGFPSRVRGVGRVPDAGLPNLKGPLISPRQTYADYLTVPQFGTCIGGSLVNPCVGAGPILPSYRFWSDDTRILLFVKACPSASSPVLPCRDGRGQVIPDPDGQDGFVCAMNPGTTYINLTVGVHQARQQITVDPWPGGVCNEQPRPIPVTPPPPPKIAVQPQPPAPFNVVVPVHHPAKAPQPQPPVALVVPPPVPVLAPAPPLTAAGTAAKKEQEREKAFEHSSEKGDGHHAAMAYDRALAVWDPRPAMLGGGAALGMLIFCSAWAVTRRRPEAAIDVRRWE